MYWFYCSFFCGFRDIKDRVVLKIFEHSECMTLASPRALQQTRPIYDTLGRTTPHDLTTSVSSLGQSVSCTSPHEVSSRFCSFLLHEFISSSFISCSYKLCLCWLESPFLRAVAPASQFILSSVLQAPLICFFLNYSNSYTHILQLCNIRLLIYCHLRLVITVNNNLVIVPCAIFWQLWLNFVLNLAKHMWIVSHNCDFFFSVLHRRGLCWGVPVKTKAMSYIGLGFIPSWNLFASIYHLRFFL